MDEARIADAVVAPGHDGQAVLVVRVRHANGAVGSVTLDADAARKLMDDCGVAAAEGLRGQPWQRLLHVLEPAAPAHAPSEPSRPHAAGAEE